MPENKYYGKFRAFVSDINDPEKRARIRVTCPKVLGKGKSIWCEPCIPVAFDEGGDFFLPPVGETVWVEFEDGDIRHPVWVGGWFSKDKTPLGTRYDAKDKIRIISFGGTQIALQNGSATIITNNTSLVLDSNNMNYLNWCITNKYNLETLVNHKDNTVYLSNNVDSIRGLINNKSSLDNLVSMESDIKELTSNKEELLKYLGLDYASLQWLVDNKSLIEKKINE